MPPKPQVFKTPDGKEFSTRAEWRDYMMQTFYSFKNKSNETSIKPPGSVDGQMFDIADCDGCTLAILDHTEQIQIDQVKNSRIFIGACTSSIFIRNCENCIIYSCCRQLRLREVINCTFYSYSMGEIHIEYSNGLRFGSFNGGYPEHAQHMKTANLDVSHNLWYDIYDHNDPGKTHANWALLQDSDYEAMWFPAGQPCEVAIVKTRPGSIAKPVEDNNMQSFSLQQMMIDSKKTAAAPVPAPPVAAVASEILMPPPVPEVATKDIAPICEQASAVGAALKAFAKLKPGDNVSDVVGSGFSLVMPNGSVLSGEAFTAFAMSNANELWTVNKITVSAGKDMAFASFWMTESGIVDGAPVDGVSHYTAVLQFHSGKWLVSHAQKSTMVRFEEAPPPFYE